MLRIQVLETEWRILLKRQKKLNSLLAVGIRFLLSLISPKKFKITPNLHCMMHLFTI